MVQEQNLPRWLIRSLRTRFGIREFVETGTLHGETVVIAAEQIPCCHTIEISRSMYDQACRECRHNPKITRHLGASVEVIPQILPSLTGPTLWYLDGHWSGFGPRLGPECPVLDEIRLLDIRPRDVVIVDDARLFIEGVPEPHRQAEWPNLDQVAQALHGEGTGHGRAVQLLGDQIFAGPYPFWRTL